MSRDSRPRLARSLLWVGALAAVVRLVYFTDHLGSTYFGVPILDEAFYDALARALLAGEPIAAVNPGFRPLLYPAFLAVAYALGGSWAAFVAELAQHLLGIGTALLVAALAGRLARSPAAALAAGSLYALAGPPLYFEGERLITTLFTFLVVATLWGTVRADAGDSGWTAWVGAGALAAVATEARPNGLVFLAVFLGIGAWRAWSRRRGAVADAGSVGGPLLAAPAGLLVGLLIAGWIQAPLLGGEAFPGGSGGVNFYLGNARDADGKTPVQDRGVVTGTAYRDSVEVFAREEYVAATGWSGPGAPSAGAVSRYWWRRGLEEIRAAPGRWLRLLGRKTAYLFGAGEIPNNKSYRFAVEEESRVLDWMPVRWWLLLALAPLGILPIRERSPRSWIWVPAWTLLYGGSLVLFFVNGRFRIPLWPALAALAGVGLVDLVRAARRGPRAWAPRLAAGLGLVALSLATAPGEDPAHRGRDHLFRSMAAREKGLEVLALEDAVRATEILPGDPAAWLQLAVTAQDAGRTALAREANERARDLAPGEPRPWNNLGVLLDEAGRHGEAYRHYLEALERLPTYGPALVNAALLEVRAGRIEAAAAHLDAAAAAGYTSPSASLARARILAARGRPEEAERLRERVAREAPETARRLEAELDLPLAPGALDP